MDLASVERIMRQAADPNPQLAVPATQQLSVISKQPGYTQALIQVFSQNVHTPFGFWCSVALKSHILQYWEPSPGEEGDVLSEQDRAAVRQTLVSMLLSCPPEHKAQIVHAIGIVSVSDYPAKWPTLIEELTSKLSADDSKLDSVIFEAIHTVCLRFRQVDEITDDVVKDLVNVHQILPTVMMTFIRIVRSAEQKLAAINAGQSCLRTALSGTVSGIEIASLNSQLQTLLYVLEIIIDLHSIESSGFASNAENLNVFFTAIFSLLSVPAFNIPSQLSDYRGSSLDAIHRLSIQIVHLFASKYEEDFAPLINNAVFVVWTVLQSRDNSPRHDGLMCACLRFFSHLAGSQWYSSFFDDEKLVGLIDNVVIRHVTARQDDIDAVTADESYLERELISTANEEVSKRGAVIRLIESLGSFYAPKVERLVLAQINRFTENYRRNTEANWVDAESALVLSIALGQRVQGQTHPFPPEMTQYVGSNVVPLLNDYISKAPPSPLLVISALKALSTYRTLIPSEAVLPMLKVLLHYIVSDEHIIASYSAYCLSMFVGQGGIVPKQITETVASDLTTALLNSLNTHHENQYILAAIITNIGAAPKHVLPIAPTLTEKIFALLAQAMKAKTNQRYVYLLFELLALVMRLVIGHSVQDAKNATLGQLETLLFPSFQQILADPEMADLHPFVFTIMAMFLEEHQHDVPAAYVPIWGLLLKADFWKSNGNIPSLVRFITAFLHNNVSTPCIQLGLDTVPVQQALTGIYQRLTTVPKTHYHAFKLSQGIAAYTNVFTSGDNLAKILRVQFKQLAEHKESAAVRYQLVWLWSFWIITDSLRPDYIQQGTHRIRTTWWRPNGFLPSSDEWYSQIVGIPDLSNSSITILFKTMNLIQNGITNAVFEKVWPTGMKHVDNFIDKKLFYRSSLILTRWISISATNSPHAQALQTHVTKIFEILRNYASNLTQTVTSLQTSGIVDDNSNPPSHHLCSQAAWAIENRSTLGKTPDIILRCAQQQNPFDLIDANGCLGLLLTAAPQLTQLAQPQAQ